MKKLLLFAAVGTAFTFTSCKKDHTCTCSSTSTSTTTVVTDYETMPTETTTDTDTDADAGSIIFNDAKKKDAKKACIDSSTERTDVNVYEGSTFNSTTWTYEDYTETTTTVTKTDMSCSLK
jgi:hypothetical protein